MYIVTVIFHLLVCFILIGVVLLQAGKGAEMGAAFGGSSQTLFGSRGAAPFLSKLTIGAAVLYMITSLTLSILTKGRSVMSPVTDTKTTESKPEPPPVASTTAPMPSK
jgi:preprotein translocase subunit SecG